MVVGMSRTDSGEISCTKLAAYRTCGFSCSKTCVLYVITIQFSGIKLLLLL